MALTGDHPGPPLAPATAAAAVADEAGARFGVDASVLGERAALGGLGRQGRTSCGGATRLLRARDGWVALSLARPADMASVPALLGVDASWPDIEAAVADRPVATLVADAVLLGMACGAVGRETGPFATTGAGRGATRSVTDLRVVDLSALWAGPLCAHLLGSAGACVVKVEDVRRPDGARGGPPAFFDLLNGGKASVALDFSSSDGRARLRALVDSADIVVTSARARAFEQLGLSPHDVPGTDRVWVAVTAYGWDVDRIGFGDDVAASVGLVAWGDDDVPRFACDAVADPLCGLLAAEAALAAAVAGGRWFVDASLAGAAGRGVPVARPAVAAEAVEGGWSLGPYPVREPTARPPAEPARPLGADTEAVVP